MSSELKSLSRCHNMRHLRKRRSNIAKIYIYFVSPYSAEFLEEENISFWGNAIGPFLMHVRIWSPLAVPQENQRLDGTLNYGENPATRTAFTHLRGTRISLCSSRNEKTPHGSGDHFDQAMNVLDGDKVLHCRKQTAWDHSVC